MAFDPLKGWLFVAVVLIAASLPASATIVARLSFEEMVRDSDTIIHGSVVKKWSGWDGEHRAIWTHYELVISESLKGARGARIVISEPGGEVGGTAMQVIGVPEYEIGDEVVVFTTMTPIGYARTSGWGQGKFEIVTPSSGTARLVRSGAAGIRLVDPTGATVRTNVESTAIPSLDGLTVDGLKSRIREAVRVESNASVR